MIRSALVSIAVVTASMSCGDTADSAGGGGPQPPPEGCELQSTPPDFVYPVGPFGTGRGDTIENFALDDCDGQEIRFDQILSHAELVLFNIGAGWCQPCIEESETLDAKIFRPMCQRGLRVVQVLFQDQDSGRATGLFCQRWRDDFELSFPVLKDPLFETQVYFTDHLAQTPLNLLVDGDGVILQRFTAFPPADLPDIIDGLLPP